MRKKFIAGNWKMYTNSQSAQELASAVVKGLGAESKVLVGLFPPFPYLSQVAGIAKGSPVVVGAQNVYPEKEGAFTGEVSPTMLLDVGCSHVIIGHSERRHKLGEKDSFLNRKVKAALAAGLKVILCVGETLDERLENQTEAVLRSQLDGGLSDFQSAELANVVIAYEPVWAIGTGRNATPEQAQQAHTFIRSEIARKFGEESARSLLIQYGGSVKAENVASLLGQSEVDGALVGGASLQADVFLAIVRIAAACS